MTDKVASKDIPSHAFRMVREIRDPIYGYVYVNEYENEMIDTPEFQRLDRVLQMPTAHFVYPSGCYTRKSHSLGAMHLSSIAFIRILYRQSHEMRTKISPLFVEPIVMDRKLDQGLDRFDQRLGNKWWDSKSFPEILQCLRLASLLHDIGHAPFCHQFEEVCRELKKEDSSMEFDHEKMGLEIVRDKLESKFRKPFCYEDVEKILGGDFQVPDFLHELVDGPYDCDKLDYLQRDSYHTGTREYGAIDYERVVSGFRAKGKLLVSKSAVGALMNSFKAVQYMYTNVYYHKTSRIFDFMISDALMSIPEFIKDMISETDKFLRYDSLNFIPSLKRKNSAGTRDDFKRARRIFKDISDRKKHYSHIYAHPITLRLAATREKFLSNLEREIKEKSGDLCVRVDYAASIQPVGINLPDLLKWLVNDNIYDEEDSQTKNLEEINRAYFRELTRYVILFRVYGKAKQMKNATFDYEKKKIKNHCIQQIEDMEKEESY